MHISKIVFHISVQHVMPNQSRYNHAPYVSPTYFQPLSFKNLQMLDYSH